VKKLILLSALFAALCVPALAGGQGGNNQGGNGGNNQGGDSQGGGGHRAAPSRIAGAGLADIEESLNEPRLNRYDRSNQSLRGAIIETARFYHATRCSGCAAARGAGAGTWQRALAPNWTAKDL
jgi:hypothetical protein